MSKFYRKVGHLNKFHRGKHYLTSPKSKKERIGVPTGLFDCNGNEILSGDTIHIKCSGYQGPVLWHPIDEVYSVFLDYSLWYGDRNPLNSRNYGKVIPIPADNGMRMELEPVNIDLMKMYREGNISRW